MDTPRLTEANQYELIERATAKLQRPATAKEVFVGEFFHVWQWPQQLYDGSTATFESLSRPDTVTVLATDEHGQIIMTRQSQPGFQDFWSLPGGVIDEGEAVWAAAKRELLEETGFVSDEWYFLFSSQLNSRIDWANYYLVAKNCRLQAALQPDAGEKISVELMGQADFKQLLRSKEFRNTDFALWWWREGEEKKITEF